ncbi:hypothetical protein ACJX0J_039329, partial [Zea mays]
MTSKAKTQTAYLGPPHVPQDRGAFWKKYLQDCMSIILYDMPSFCVRIIPFLDLNMVNTRKNKLVFIVAV